MGLICTKVSAVEDSRESPPKRAASISSRHHSELKVSRFNSSKREEPVWTKDRLGGGGDVKIMLVDKKVNGSIRSYDQTMRKKMDKAEVALLDHPGSRRIPSATVAEQLAAGWPGWLAAAAPEAINGWIPRRADTFEKLNKVCSILYLIQYMMYLLCYCISIANAIVQGNVLKA